MQNEPKSSIDTVIILQIGSISLKSSERICVLVENKSYGANREHLVNWVFIQWQIQDFPEVGGGGQLPKWVCLHIFWAENCMKMKEFGPGWGGGGLRPCHPP